MSHKSPSTLLAYFSLPLLCIWGGFELITAILNPELMPEHLTRSLQLPKSKQPVNDSFQLNSEAFFYPKAKQTSPQPAKVSVPDIYSAKLLGTVLGESESDHIAFLSESQKSESLSFKVNDRFMNYNILSISQNAVSFDMGNDVFTLYLHGFQPKPPTSETNSDIGAHSPDIEVIHLQGSTSEGASADQEATRASSSQLDPSSSPALNKDASDHAYAKDQREPSSKDASGENSTKKGPPKRKRNGKSAWKK